MAENILAGVFARFMEAIHVELANETVDVAMPEMFRENLILKLIDLFDGKLSAIGHPMNNRLIVLILENIKALLYEVGDCVVPCFLGHILQFLNSIFLNRQSTALQ